MNLRVDLNFVCTTVRLPFAEFAEEPLGPGFTYANKDEESERLV